MLQGTLDPATPYAGAQDAHKLLPSARMVVVEGGGNHGQSLEQPSDSCVQGYLNAYLGHRGAARGAGAGQCHLPGRARPDAGNLMTREPDEELSVVLPRVGWGYVAGKAAMVRLGAAAR